jgi:hypothetical protein
MISCILAATKLEALLAQASEIGLDLDETATEIVTLQMDAAQLLPREALLPLLQPAEKGPGECCVRSCSHTAPLAATASSAGVYTRQTVGSHVCAHMRDCAFVVYSHSHPFWTPT